MKRFISFLLALVLSVVLVVPITAADSSSSTPVEVPSTGNFFQWLASQSPDGVQAVVGLLASGVCPISEDGKHHGYLTGRAAAGQQECKCNDCGETYMVTDAEVDAAYQVYTEQLPATSIDSDGYLYWIPSFDYGRISDTSSAQTCYFYWGNTSNESTFSIQNLSFDSEYNPVIFTSLVEGSGTGTIFGDVTLYTSDFAPISGYYYQDGLSLSGYYLSDGERYSLSNDLTVKQKSFFYDAQSEVSFNFTGVKFARNSYYYISYNYLYARIDVPPIKIKPASGLIDPGSDATYNNNSRPQFNGPVGVYDSSNNLTTYEDCIIFDESSNLFTDPATGEQVEVTDWTYDYVTRQYLLTTGDGNTITVTYNADQVSIVNGDVTNNYYYLVDGDGGSGGGSSGGDGDGSGDGSGGGGDDGGSSGGGLLEQLVNLILKPLELLVGLVEQIIGWVLDQLTGLVDMLVLKLEGIISSILSVLDLLPPLFAGFYGFLGAAFGFLPPELLAILQLGLLAYVVVGILKLIFNR